jgi:hypothetical protein
LAIRDAADGKCFVQSTALTPNYYSGEYLDSLLISLHNPRVDTDDVAHLKSVRVGFLLLFLDGIDDLVHKNTFLQPSGATFSSREAEFANAKVNPFSDLAIYRFSD